jgi:hypothetical protein
MNMMNEGVRRSLVARDIARMQVEDAAEAAAKQSTTIDWSPVDGGDMFCGSVPGLAGASLPVVEPPKTLGLGQRVLQRLNTLLHGRTKPA